MDAPRKSRSRAGERRPPVPRTRGEERTERTQPSAACARIFYMDPALIGALPRWDAPLDDCARMGFDTVLIAPPFAPGATRDPFLAGDYARTNASLEWERDAVSALGALAERCAARGLGLELDVRLDASAAENPAVRAEPDLYRLRALRDGEPPDPRRIAEAPAAAVARFDDTAHAARLGDIWIERLRKWRDAGVTGFRFLAPQRVPAEVWTRVLAPLSSGAARLSAWTPGLAAEEVAALAACGFDAVYSSLPWWDFRAGWLLEEDARLHRIGDVIAPVEVPFGERLAARYADATTFRRAAARLLDFTASFADGLLVPIGFEHGARRPLPSRDASPADLAAMREDGIADIRDALTRANATLAGRAAEARDVRDLAGAGRTITRAP